MNLMMILRQLWNQRAANGWILGELSNSSYSFSALSYSFDSI